MSDANIPFSELGLSENLLKALKQIGYETPSPIQAKSIPPLLEGRDIIGQAQTGTGKTAAFALPALNNVNLRSKSPQVLVLTPTRELALQVSESFQSYARHMSGFHILPIYGGQAYDVQIRSLKRGVQVVVGTPGRVMDHMRKGTFKLDNLSLFVLDEADEMLRMGFIDDVEWILSHAPEKRQIALFSATMPPEIAKVAKTYLKDPVDVKIKMTTAAADTIRQRYWPVSGLHKLDAITRILEVEPFDAMIVFVRTKNTTVELAEKLEARGFRSAALNGDITQKLREATVEKLKNKKIDILVATDVAARGLDVDRISHVLNYDIPYDTEAYVHRIGRTGRAGRTGEAILFAAKREMRMLRSIEKATGKTIEPMVLPSAKDINEQRVLRFKKNLEEILAANNLDGFKDIITSFQKEHGNELLDIAAALAKISQGDTPLLLEEKDLPQGFKESRHDNDSGSSRKRRNDSEENIPMETYRIEVGRADGVKPGNIVGAIANEADIDSKFIGHIKIHDDHCTVDLPKGMPKETFVALKKTMVCQKPLRISLLGEGGEVKGFPSKSGKSKKKVRSKPRSDARPPNMDNKEGREIRKRPKKAK